MPNVQFFKCKLCTSDCRGSVARVHGNTSQTLVATSKGLAPLIFGSDIYSGGLSIGPELDLYCARKADDDPSAPRRPFVSVRGLERPIWDPWSASVYAIAGSAIFRITDDEVSLMAGSVDRVGQRDGEGSEARFLSLEYLASDGEGTLFCADGQKLRKVQLPAWLHQGIEQGAGGPIGAEGEPVVSTLAVMAADSLRGLVHLADAAGGPGSLVYATPTALYRLRLGGENGAAPVLLAGREGVMGSDDGRGQEARFQFLWGLDLDAQGNILCADVTISHSRAHEKSALRCVARDGTTTTLVASEKGGLCSPSIFPNGCLACNSRYGDVLVVLSLGLKPRPLTPPSTTTSSDFQPGSLPADWGALLKEPDDTSDLTVLAGGQVFPVHRLVVRVRCEYFRRCLAEGAFVEGSGTTLTLPDADPDVFALVLQFIYTGTVDMPAAMACSVAELSDRLLLPVLCAAACSKVLAGVVPATVVEALLWAEGCAVRGGSFPQLLSDLKAWYVEYYREVKREAGASVRRLMTTSPDLMMQLLDLVDESQEQAAKRQRY